MSEAVEEFVDPGADLYLGNFGTAAFGAAHEIIRRGIGDLRVLMSSGGLLMDQLIGAGLLREALTTHCWGSVGPLPAANFRRALEDPGEGSPRVEDYSYGTFTAALMAGAYDMPFVPTTPMQRTGHDEHRARPEADKYDRLEDPFTGEDVSVVKALRPEVAFVIVHRADRRGRGQWFGPRGELAHVGLAARRTVLIAEEIVGTDDVQKRPEATLPIANVEALVHEPWTAHPESLFGMYHRDAEHVVYYCRRSRSVEGFEEYADRYIHGVNDREEYVERLREDGKFDLERTVFP